MRIHQKILVVEDLKRIMRKQLRLLWTEFIRDKQHDPFLRETIALRDFPPRQRQPITLTPDMPSGTVLMDTRTRLDFDEWFETWFPRWLEEYRRRNPSTLVFNTRREARLWKSRSA